MKSITFVAMLFGGFLFSLLISNNHAYGFVDNEGNYSCDPQHLDLEKVQYRTVVEGLNNAFKSYQNDFPNASDQQIHSTVMNIGYNSHQNYVDLMYKMQECLSSNGIDPNSVAQVSKDVMHAIAVPEFGSIAEMVILVGIIGSIVIYRKFF